MGADWKKNRAKYSTGNTTPKGFCPRVSDYPVLLDAQSREQTGLTKNRFH